MITDDTDFLPLEASPYFVKLVSFFNRSLEDAVETFQTEKNEAAFTKVLDYFVNDFDYYQANYQYWQQEAKTDIDRMRLEVLKPLLEESAQLINRAAGLIRH